MDVVTILAATAMVAIPSWFAHRNHKDLKEVVYQTKNNHETNLRDDIDRAIRAVEQLGHDVRGIRTDLAAEEDRRRHQVAELEDRLNKVSRHQ
jgi:uncharacterized protein (UPF0264 family)